MKLRMHCTVHNCPVISAEDSLHWIPSEEIPVPNTLLAKALYPSAWELDYANLYCTGTGDYNHNFIVQIEFNGPGYAR